MIVYDDLGAPTEISGTVTRIVSLVPSLTESIAASRPETLVGATDWCTHPAELDVVRVRGTKNPDRSAIIDLRPDLVLANKEENRELDVRKLRESGVPVWVSVIETVPQALEALHRLFADVLRWPTPGWLTEATELWSQPTGPTTARTAIPVWRDPWMVVGSSTFAGDLVRRLGLENVFASHPDRYPKVAVEELDRDDVDVVLLPDEPYPFTADDGPEMFHRVRTELVSGRLLTWYGPSLVQAYDELARLAAQRRWTR